MGRQISEQEKEKEEHGQIQEGPGRTACPATKKGLVIFLNQLATVSFSK